MFYLKCFSIRGTSVNLSTLSSTDRVRKSLNGHDSTFVFNATISLFSAPYSPYFPHLKGYFDYFNSCEDTNVSKSNMLITSFEEMKKTPQKVIGDIARHLNIEVSQDDIEEIAKQTSFEVMKRNSRTNYEHWDQLGITHKNSEKFYRKGQVGSFNDDLSHHDNAHLNKWIESQRWIPSFQYSVHGQSSNNNEQK